ncbi:tetratricopeptide repeat protein [uncultured Chloroflexus sp.]|uniref:tetratricopeptide repeat protein n=1 Tax=uncultured Chloroflexus sp. TaxID=214040 RepID=UPI002620CB8C|nr:tetratricopeptide repeat protein [uncultured Chloroflexus sp.]
MWLAKARTPTLTMFICLTIIFSIAIALSGSLDIHRGASLLDQADGIDASHPELLAEAIVYLQPAAEHESNDPLTLRYLARAYRASGQQEKAITVLERARYLNPNSLLVKWELVFAYRDAGRPDYLLEKELGYSPEALIVAAEQGLESEHYQETLQLYSHLAKHWPEHYSQEMAFCHLIAAISLLDGLPDFLRESEEKFTRYYAVGDGIPHSIVPGFELRWVYPNCGTLLNSQHGGADAIFWWGGRGSIIVEVRQPGLYQFHVSALNDDPPPVEMLFGINGRPVHSVSLTKGDRSWETIVLTIPLSKSVVSFDVWFVNDFADPVVDRNASISQVEIVRVQFDSDGS